MKTFKHTLLGLAASTALLAAGGCSKEDKPTGSTQPGTEAKPIGAELKKVADDASKAVGSAATSVRTQAVAMESATKDAISHAKAAAVPEVQTLVDKAKAYIADNKYQDALTVIQQLKSMTLTDEEQRLVDGLKLKIQAALARTAATPSGVAIPSKPPEKQ